MARKRHVILSVVTQTVVCIALIAGAGAIFALLWNTRPQPAKVDEPPPPRRVAVMEARAVPVRRQWMGFGTANARDEADIPAEVTAVVVEIPRTVVEGAEIEQGSIVARLDDTDFVIQRQMSTERIGDLTAQLAQLDLEEASWRRRVELAEQDVALAEADLARVREAFERGAARQREIDQAKQKVVAAVRLEVEAREQLDRIAPRRSRLEALRAEQEASLRLAAKNVERCTIRSPLAGVIQSVDVEVGESLAPGQRVARVVDLDSMEVPLRLPAGARAAIARGDEVVLESLGQSSQTWLGEVARINPADDQATRTMTVYVELEQDPRDPGALAPGRFVQGTVISRRAELRYVVPRRSLLGDRLLVVVDGRVESRAVHVDFHVQGEFRELGVVAEQWAVLAQPLQEGSRVVVNAARSLSEGLHVEPVSRAGDIPGDATASGAGR